MNVLELFRSFKTQEQAVDHLEAVRWRGEPACPYCQSKKVCRHVSGDRAGQRWQCQECSRAFAATVGTIFHGTHVPLRNWFLVLALTLPSNATGNASQIARDLGLRRPTVWKMLKQIREALADNPDQGRLLRAIVATTARRTQLKRGRGRFRKFAPNKKGLTGEAA